MALIQTVESVLGPAVGPIIAKGIIKGCAQKMGKTPDQVTDGDSDTFMKQMEVVLPTFAGKDTATTLIEKIKGSL